MTGSLSRGEDQKKWLGFVGESGRIKGIVNTLDEVAREQGGNVIKERSARNLRW